MSIPASSVTKWDIIRLYSSLLKFSKQFDNYNFRKHAYRRIQYEFRENKSAPATEIPQLYAQGRKQLELVRRQAIISQLYPEMISVLEKK